MGYGNITDEQKKAISVVPYGGSGGNPWDDEGHCGVIKIVLTHGDCIDSMQTLYAKPCGEPVWSKKHGGSGGHQHSEVQLDCPNEYLTAVSGYCHPMQNGNPPVVRSLKFKSNRKTFGPFGKETGTPFSVAMEGESGKIVGFHGRSGSYIDCVGPHIKQTK